MYNKKQQEFIITYIKFHFKTYAHNIGYKNKWNNFINKKINKVVVEWPTLNDGGHKYNREYEYIDKRHRQFSQQSKILLCSNNFIESIINFTKELPFCDLAFGLKEKDKDKIFPFMWDPEETMRIQNLWKYLLQHNDILILKNNIEKVKAMNVSQFNRLLKNLPSQYFYIGVEKLMDSFGLSLIWKDSIILLLLSGYFLVPDNFCPIIVEYYGGRQKISIPILPETRKEDLANNWNKIKEKKEEVYGKSRIRTTKDFNNYLKINQEKEKDKKRYWDYVDFDKIPDGVKYENAAHDRLRKGSINVKELIENVGKSDLNELKHIKLLKEFAGYEEGTFIF